MTGVFALDLCGNRSGGAKPRSTALGGMGSMPIMSWLRLYEFTVLPHGITKREMAGSEILQEEFQSRECMQYS